MADIFVSHSGQDREVAKTLALFLKVQGWTVWWDKTLLKDRDPHTVGMAEVRAAHLVIVIWSKSSVSDAFVMEEAIAARDAGKLFMVSNPDAPPKHIPLPHGKDRPPDASDLMQISMAVSSLMRKRGRQPMPMPKPKD